MLNAQQQASNPATALSEAHTGAATVVSCGHSVPQHVDEDVQSYGANSPRAARSQISTAVSFEGARPAGSAAVADCSVGEDSAHSVADPEGENSSMPAAPAAAWRAFAAQPTTSLLSTAVRASSPPPRQPGSPELYRANSVVSNSEANQRAARAGTPASVYAQGRVFPTPRNRPVSPEASRAGEQDSGSGEPNHSARSSRRVHGVQGGRTGQSTKGYISQSARAGRSRRGGNDAAASRQASFLAPGDNAVVNVQLAEINSMEAPHHGAGRGKPGSDGAFPTRKQRSASNAGENLLLQRLASSHSQLGVPPRLGSSERANIDKAMLNMKTALKGCKATSPQQEQAEALLQHQNSAVLGSGLLTQQAQGLGLGFQNSGAAAPHTSDWKDGREPKATGMHGEAQAYRPSGTNQPLFQASEPFEPHAQRQMSTDEAFSEPKPQAAIQQGLDEPAGLASDVEMTGPSHNRSPPPSSPGHPEASGSRLGAGLVSANSSGSQQPPEASENAYGASAQAQVVGCAPWDEPAAANGAVTSGAGAYLDAMSEEGAAQPANSVLGTLVNDDAHSEGIDDDTRSLQPSRQQAALDLGMPLANPDPSQHDSVLPTHSGDGGPADAVATDAAALQMQNRLSNAELPTEAAVTMLGNQASNMQLLQAAAAATLDLHSAAAVILGAQQNAAPPLSTAGYRPMDEVPAALPPLHPTASANIKQPVSTFKSARLTQGSSPGSAKAAPCPEGPLRSDSHASARPPQPQESVDGAAAASQSGGKPAVATLRSESDVAVGGHETVAQSQPPPNGALRPPGPQPALTIVMQGGLLGPSNEPDDGAAGPIGSEARRLPSNGFTEHSSKAASGIVSPSNHSAGRPKREATKRKRSISS